MTTKERPKLHARQHVVSRGVAAVCDLDPEMQGFVMECLRRHYAHDWGDIDADDKRANDWSVGNGERVVSSYDLPLRYRTDAQRAIARCDTKLWVVTERDRSVTTALFPTEY